MWTIYPKLHLYYFLLYLSYCYIKNLKHFHIYQSVYAIMSLLLLFLLLQILTIYLVNISLSFKNQVRCHFFSIYSHFQDVSGPISMIILIQTSMTELYIFNHHFLLLGLSPLLDN